MAQPFMQQCEVHHTLPDLAQKKVALPSIVLVNNLVNDLQLHAMRTADHQRNHHGNWQNDIPT